MPRYGFPFTRTGAAGSAAAKVTRSSGGEIHPLGLVRVTALAADATCHVWPAGMMARRVPSGSLTARASPPPTLAMGGPTTRPTLISGSRCAATGAGTGTGTGAGTGVGTGGGASAGLRAGTDPETQPDD